MATCSVCGRRGWRGSQIGVYRGRYLCGVNFGCHKPEPFALLPRVLNYLKAQGGK